MNYTQEGRRYIANEGYVFALKPDYNIIAKVISIRLINYYDCILEPQPKLENENETGGEDNDESSVSI